MVGSEWLVEIECVTGALLDADRQSFPSLARRLHHALDHAPAAVRASLGRPCSVDRLNALLTQEAYREAAFELLGETQYMLSRSRHRHVIATVAADNLFREQTLGSEHEATAFAGALALGLLSWARSAAISSQERAAI